MTENPKRTHTGQNPPLIAWILPKSSKSTFV